MLVGHLELHLLYLGHHQALSQEDHEFNTILGDKVRDPAPRENDKPSLLGGVWVSLQ